MDPESIYQLIKIHEIRSPEFQLSTLPPGASVVLLNGIQGVLVSDNEILTSSNERRRFERTELGQVENDMVTSRISRRTAVLSLTAATKAFGWIGGIVGAGIASTTVTVQNYMIGVPWGATQTTLASKMGMSVGSLALVSSWIGFGVGVVATPFVYMCLRHRVQNEYNPISVFNQTENEVQVTITEITNVTISYTCIPSKPVIRTLYTLNVPPKGVVLDIPIPNEETSLFKLENVSIKPYSVYTIRGDNKIEKLVPLVM